MSLILVHAPLPLESEMSPIQLANHTLHYPLLLPPLPLKLPKATNATMKKEGTIRALNQKNIFKMINLNLRLNDLFRWTFLLVIHTRSVMAILKGKGEEHSNQLLKDSYLTINLMSTNVPRKLNRVILLPNPIPMPRQSLVLRP
jgi:hypothetical protein